jgi:hypothetical protein
MRNAWFNKYGRTDDMIKLDRKWKSIGKLAASPAGLAGVKYV